jgi:hypothetical protein
MDFDLKSIPEKTVQKLKQRIQEANGKLIIVVHPYFNVFNQTSYLNSIKKNLHQSNTPVIVLEQFHLINPEEAGKRFNLSQEKNQSLKNHSEKHLSKINAEKNIVIPTLMRSSIPFFYDSPENQMYSLQELKTQSSEKINEMKKLIEREKQLIEFIASLKPKKIFIAGSNATATKKSRRLKVMLKVREYEQNRLPRKKETNKRYSSIPFIDECAGSIYAALIEKGLNVAWLPKAVKIKGNYASPYPHPLRRRKITTRKKIIH